MRKPLARLEILLLKRRVEHTESPDLTRGRCVVTLDVGLSLTVGGLEGDSASGLTMGVSESFGAWRIGRRVKMAYLLLVVQALVVILQDGLAFDLAGVGLWGCVGDVAGEDFLPEGEAAGGAWED